MSRELFSRSADLARLRTEGFFVQQVGGFLVMREVPYLNAKGEVKRGTLISTLAVAGETTQRPSPHTIHFDGEFPHAADGRQLSEIACQSMAFDLGHGLKAQHMFSSKPDRSFYVDYHEKMTTYAALVSGPAQVTDPNASARVFRVPDEDEDSVFNYTDTATDRAGIGALAERLKADRIGIVGLGGSGSYILDLVAKTPVAAIHLFDGDAFLQHNAFRAPGAPSLEELREAPPKVEHLGALYSRMHRRILPHPEHLGAGNLHLLDGLTFAFLSIDDAAAKAPIVARLEQMGMAFVDVGMGLELTDGSLGGILRITTSTPDKRRHVHQGRISFEGGGEREVYESNIQVADLNALNAALAVVKWKKLRGFYRDFEREHHATYTTDGNMLVNGDQA